MTIKFNLLKSKALISSKNLALFSDENFKILNFKSLNLPNQGLISDLIQNNKDKKRILHLNLNKKQILLIIKLNQKQDSLENEKLGAKFYDYIYLNLINDLTFIDKNFYERNLNQTFIDEFFHGIELKSYEFKDTNQKKIPGNLKLI